MSVTSEVKSCAVVLNVDQIVLRQEEWRNGLHSRSLRQLVRSIISQYLISPFFLLSYSFVLVFMPGEILRSLSIAAARQAIRAAVLRTIDVLGAAFGLLCSLPFFVVLPVLIKLDSPGPVFYKQIRTGLNRRGKQRNGRLKEGSGEDQNDCEMRQQDIYGKPFHIYKFRTMRNDAEKNGAVWAKKNDPRITRVGKWLRRTHIDEIPQFLNVLKGDMSLVGPRPERPEIIASLIEKYPAYQERLAVKPGLTGVSQICLGYDSSLDDVRKKTSLDMLYISHQSVLLQLKVLFYTAIYILSSKPVNQALFFNATHARRQLNYRLSYENTY
jgi:lipopolysaccharide/colanic/teichoic acid biosynthesis glycosyltransferase